MQLNEVHNHHEHASTTLKFLLLVFAVVLVAALGFMVWFQNNSYQDTADYTAPSVKKAEKAAETTSGTDATAPAAEDQTTTADDTADWKTFSSTLLGISFKYPPSYGEATIKTGKGGYFNDQGMLQEGGKIATVTFSNYADAEKRDEGGYIEACAVSPDFRSDRGDSDACWITNFEPQETYKKVTNRSGTTTYIRENYEFFGMQTSGYILLDKETGYIVLTLSSSTKNSQFKSDIEKILKSSESL